MKFSPLDAQHRAMSAKMTPFGGWEMPLAYETGTIAEHQACRQTAAMFDVSHLGTVRVKGKNVLDELQSVFTNDLTKIEPGRAQYTHLLDDNDGSVLDDIIVWWINSDTFDVMPNASNTARVVAAIGGIDTTDTRAIIAIQGPQARKMVSSFCAEAADVKRFRVQEVMVCGHSCVVAGTGYTGEDGIEIAVPRDGALAVWAACLEAGVVPAGLGARDTLRLEAGLPLHGHELGPGISTLQANLEWVVAWNKKDFRGRTALLAEKERGVTRLLRGISIEGRRPARDGCTVLDQNGNTLGTVSSGNFSPSLGHCIAFAFLLPTTQIGDVVQLDVRGALLKGQICSIPFVKKQP